MFATIKVPFIASTHAFRTNFNGPSTDSPVLTSQLEQMKKAYKDTLTDFEYADQDARKEYKEAKDMGLANNSFGAWVPQNYPQWAHATQTLQANGAQLTQIATQAFGQA